MQLITKVHRHAHVPVCKSNEDAYRWLRISCMLMSYTGAYWLFRFLLLHEETPNFCEPSGFFNIPYLRANVLVDGKPTYRIYQTSYDAWTKMFRVSNVGVYKYANSWCHISLICSIMLRHYRCLHVGRAYCFQQLFNLGVDERRIKIYAHYDQGALLCNTYAHVLKHFYMDRYTYACISTHID